MSADTTSPLTRQACERCRGLKLRCTRINNPKTCDRCLRRGARCTYSASLPKGRRRTHPGENIGIGSVAIADMAIAAQNPIRAKSFSADLEMFHLPDLAGSDAGSAFDWFQSSQTSFFPGPPTPNNSLQNNTSIVPGSSASHDDDDPETLISQLAQLSTLISMLHRSGDDLIWEEWEADTDSISQQTNLPCAQQLLLPIGDAVFQSVTAWLSRGPIDASATCCTSESCRAQAPKIETLSDLIYHVFSASHWLVEIVRPMAAEGTSIRRVGGMSGTGMPGMASSYSVPHFLDLAQDPMSGDTLYPDSVPSVTSEMSSHVGNTTSTHVILHLLLANHTMLLEMYSRIFGLLQRYMDQAVVERGDSTDLPLLNIRLASVVHTCSYLIDRQHQGLAVYPLSSMPSMAAVSADPDVSPDVTMTESVAAIRAQVQQQIVRLQQAIQV